MKPSTSFDEWARRHQVLFGLNSDENIAMVLAWEDIFEAAGVSLPELDDATQYMATQAAPRFPSDHLPAIQQRIREQRTKREQEALREKQRGQWRDDSEWSPEVKKQWDEFLKRQGVKPAKAKRKPKSRS